ncbi:stonustoxin subunit beta-like isoform X1 [Neolamprologus brichardi]|uniref:stonustoxin subunit beta-like isoform X1 n=1 Tax=Neolamprologus brichardi TaxID=32507 RepID=UPI0003EC0C59|nr:stonustoxin subunit beta-like isoform X1 [Neolamprologus brichardi]
MPNTNRIISETRKAEKGKKAKVVKTPTAEKIPGYETNIPEPKWRADLIKYWINLSLDDKTANKMLWITDGGAKVARMTDNLACPVLDTPDRYEYVPQVLCKEGILGSRGYWEMEYSGWVVIGVAYAGAGRRNKDGPCGLGENEESWGLGWSGSSYHAWHNGRITQLVELPRCSTIGVYVDQPVGVINFYAVEDVIEGGESNGEKEVRLLKQFKSSFKEKLMPGLWVGTNSECVIKKMEE